MHVLIAPNAFKHSLTATDAAAAITDGLRASRFQGTWSSLPVADGGDGTAALLIAHHGGSVHTARVHDPLGRDIEGRFGLIADRRIAVIEMADASGLRLLTSDELDPLRASSRGTGELIAYALAAGVEHIVLGIGGSATVDGGAGLLHALGLRFVGTDGRAFVPTPGALAQRHSLDLSALDSRLQRCRITVLCDVNNPLLGQRGAAAVFGPQKGADVPGVAALETALTSLAAAIVGARAVDVSALARGGAAGGMAAGLHGVLGASLVDGIEYFLDSVGFDTALAAADVVITGEGSIDAQTAEGKGPWGVARRARRTGRAGVLVIGLAGLVPQNSHAELRSCFDVLLPIGNGPATLAQAMQMTRPNLTRTAFEIGNLLASRA